MRISEIIKENKGKYASIEVWKFTSSNHSKHTDFITNIDSIVNLSEINDVEAYDYDLMDEDEYNSSIHANDSIIEEFSEIYDDSNAIILVIWLDYDWDAVKDESEPIHYDVTDEKLEIAKYIVSLPGWVGTPDMEYLCESNSLEDLKDILEQYEEEFSDSYWEDTRQELTLQQIEDINNLSSHDKYDKKNTKRISLKLNKRTDADILEWIDKQDPVQGAIKEAIRFYLKEK